MVLILIGYLHMPKHKLVAYTDGACSGNPGPGGWGVLLQAFSDGRVVKEREIRDSIQTWLAGWKKNNWKTASKKPVKNEELWKRLDLLCEQHEVNWKWVKGHAGDMGNERVDKLARSAMEPFKED